MSISDPEVLINLYDWLETIPFSRPKKNFARDFSDAILAAELIKHFFPNLVEMHNYPNSSSIEQKKINWSTLNRRVLKKLDFPLSTLTINELASGSKREATEYFLNTLREKIDAYIGRNTEASKNISIKKDDFPAVSDDVLEPTSFVSEIMESPLNTVEHKSSKNRLSWNITSSDLDNVPREVFEKMVQELLAREETIKVLKARIQRLEETLYLKNETIQRLQQLIEKSKDSQKVYINKFPEKRLMQMKSK